MSLTPEFILQTTVDRGIRRMRGDSSLVGQLFRNVDQKSVGQMLDFVKNNAFDLCINYPRTTLKIPAIVILLKSEREEQAFLGDSMGLEVPDVFSYAGPAQTTQPAGVASTSSLSGNMRTVFGPAQALSGTANTLKTATAQWHTDQFVDVAVPTQIRILSGTGVGQTRTIVGNSRTVIMVNPGWLTIPDSTSTFDIVLPPDEVFGEPLTLYDKNNPPTALERKGGIYNVNYQIQVFGPTPELTIFMNTILKSVFTLNRSSLEAQGVMNLKMGAADFVPKPEYQPDLSYLRSLNLEFMYLFDVFDQIVGTATSIRTVIEGTPPLNSLLDEPVLSDTTVAIGGVNEVDPNAGAQRVYFGPATPATINAAFVQTLLGSEGTAVASQRQTTLVFFAGPGQAAYYVVPTRFGTQSSNFINTANGVIVPMTRPVQLSLTTAFGTETYDVWQSVQTGFGFITIQVT